MLKKTLLATASTILLSTLAMPAFAAPITGSGAGFSVPDNNLAGASSVIVLTNPGTINSLSIVVAMSHTWLGDLVMTLSNNANTIRLMDRPGRTDSGFGFSANLTTDFPITFSASATQVAESMGSGCVTVGIAPCSTDTFFLPDDSFDAFFGSSIAGSWTLNVSDRAGADTGSVASWTLNADVDVASVPEPASLALLGLGLAGLGFTRRRRT